MRALTVVLACLALMAVMVGCEDPDPGEISVQTYKSGDKMNCSVELWKTGGTQISQGSGRNGLAYLKNIAPGDYTLKFVDYDGNYYPAEITVTLSGGESLPLQVELTNEGQSALLER